MQDAKRNSILISRAKLENLLTESQKPCVSIFVPSDNLGMLGRQNRIRFKNLLRTAETQLHDYGLLDDAARALLAPARKLVRSPSAEIFWQSQDGLAVYLAPGAFYLSYRMSPNTPASVYVGPRFRVRPLLPVLAENRHFFVLALSQGSVRLLRCTRDQVEEVDLVKTPRSLAEALHHDDGEKQLQCHTGTGGRGKNGSRIAVFHGHERSDKTDIVRFLRKLNDGLMNLLKNERAPLVLAGVEYICALFRTTSSYGNLVATGIDGNPEDLGDKELQRHAWEIVASQFQVGRGEDERLYQQLIGQKDRRSAASTLERVVPAAFYQRVGTLFVPLDRQYWGAFDPQTNVVEIHEERIAGDEDLLDFTVAHTLLNGGHVHVVESAEVPGTAPVAAIFRY